jgi:hypothetical protein
VSRPLACLAVLLALVAACRREEPVAPDVVARVGEEEVRYAAFERALERTVGDDEAVLSGDVLSRLFDQFLDEELLAKVAEERGIAVGANRRRAVDALLRDGVEEAPSEAEVRRFYDEHRAEFSRPERVLLRQILVEGEETAERARAQIVAGEDFAAVARRVSRDPSAERGGLQGELSREQLPASFAEEIFALGEGEVSAVVPADYGYHLFQVVARLPEEVVPIAAAREQIVRRLRRERADRWLAALVEEARTRYTVEVYERNLPFRYEGTYGGTQRDDP